MQEIVSKTIVYIVLMIGATAMVIPFIWMISSSLKVHYQVFVFPPKWIPHPVVWSNYVRALVQVYPFYIYFRNTSIITLGQIVGSLLSCSIVAYAFARLRFPYRNVLFLIVVATMIIPLHITLIPLYIIFRKLRWIDTFKPLIVPAFFASRAFLVFLLRQFFMSIPLELDDAAKIDGCGILGIYWKILLPLSKPALATVTIFSFIWSWNDFLYPLIFLNSDSKRTLTLALAFFQGPQSGQSFVPLLMAASTASMIPAIVLFFFAQRYFIQGITITGIKG